jgi:hypothetical protein
LACDQNSFEHFSHYCHAMLAFGVSGSGKRR